MIKICQNTMSKIVNERNLCQDLLTHESTDTHCIMQMSYLYMSRDSLQSFCKLAERAETMRKNVWEKSLLAHSCC